MSDVRLRSQFIAGAGMEAIPEVAAAPGACRPVAPPAGSGEKEQGSCLARGRLEVGDRG
jgi:hypothetical protein